MTFDINITHAFDAYLATHLNDSACKRLREVATPIKLDANEAFIRQGEPNANMYFLASGIVRYYVIGNDGKEANKTFTPSPCIVGSTRALLTGEPSRLSLAALTNTDAVKIDWPAFRKLMKTHHDIERFYRIGLEKLFIMKEERESSFLLKSATERYEQFLIDHRGFWQQIPQYHIASYLGITPVSLSRIRHGNQKLR